ncbi:hypothetical protein [Alicyclobacillus acidocaldarius]|nr:hypothetical protein [Alicyclobacillus acidocaldarius]
MQVRVFWVDGEPLFDAAGVCEAVGMRNVEKALRKARTTMRRARW